MSYRILSYVMYFIESEICIGGCFLEGCFHYYSQQVTSDVANETLIPCNPANRRPGTKNF